MSVFNPDVRLNDAFPVDTAAARRVHDDLMASKPDGARHDSDICPFCVNRTDSATQDAPPSRIPPTTGGPDVSDTTRQSSTSTEGGTPESMTDNANTMTKETHDALLAKAVSDATSTTEAALARSTQELADAKTKVEQLTTDNATLKGDNDRLNGELDSAQVSLKAATDEVASLKADIAAKDEAAVKAEIASKRADQVRNLALFDEKYVGEKATAWATLSDDDWAARIDEWAKLKPAKAEPNSDAASAMSGTTDSLTKEPPSDSAQKTTSPRRAALGLV